MGAKSCCVGKKATETTDSACSTAEDSSTYASSCSGWVKSNYCESSSQYYAFMTTNCAKSCCSNKQTDTTTCSSKVDSDSYASSCASWATSNFCETSSQWYSFMSAHCAKSCCQQTTSSESGSGSDSEFRDGCASAVDNESH